MASSSSDQHHLLVDDFYFSALFDDDEVLPVSDEKYAAELHFQEALMSATIYGTMKREVKQETDRRDYQDRAVKVEVKREVGGPSHEPPPTLKPVKSEPRDGGDDQETTMMMELAKEKQWRRCPNCKFYVEKTEGCLHISCRCGFDFCYGCGVPWSGSHSCGI